MGFEELKEKVLSHMDGSPEFGISDLDQMEKIFKVAEDAMSEDTNRSVDNVELMTLLNKIYQECLHNDINFVHMFNVLINRVQVGNELLFQLCQMNKNYSSYSMNIDYALQSRDGGIHKYKRGMTDLTRLEYND